jgi:ComF family protein
MPMARILTPAIDFALDFALPPRCPGCGLIVARDHSFCTPCWMQLDFLTAAGCAQCGIPMGVLDGLSCARCLAEPPFFDAMHAAVIYGAVSRRVVLSLKYARRPGVARTIAELMVPRLTIDRGAILIPVPLHRWRLWNRGFNQSLALARQIATLTGVPVAGELLVRRRATPVLRGMNPAQRRAAVNAAFAVNGRLDDAHVYLVDDVITTGATTNACARALKRAGAARVTILGWARVIHDD